VKPPPLPAMLIGWLGDRVGYLMSDPPSAIAACILVVILIALILPPKPRCPSCMRTNISQFIGGAQVCRDCGKRF